MADVNEADDPRDSNVDWDAREDNVLDRRFRSLYDKAQEAFEKKNYDYAINLYRGILKRYPGVTEIRNQLRSAQWMKQGRSSSLVRQLLATVLGLPTAARVKAMLSGNKIREALDAAESLMTRDCTATSSVNLLAKAAERADLPETVVQTLEWGLKHHPKDQHMMVWLADLYIEAEVPDKAVDVCKRLVELAPANSKYKDKLRDAGAMSSMKDGGWTQLEKKKDGASFRDVIKDQQEASRLEQAGRTVRTEQGIDVLIEGQIEAIEQQDTVDNRRKLAEFYAEAGRLREAIEQYDLAAEMAGAMDPALDRAVTKLRMKMFDVEINKTSDAAEKERLASERDVLQINALDDRVRKFPNAHEDRIQLAELLFDRGEMDRALQHFQLLVKNPRFRTQASIWMGRCFLEKEQYDLSVDQLQRVVDTLKAMDHTRKTALYYLGHALKARGDADDAMQAYKAIYSVDLNFRDVRELVEGK